MSGSAESSRRDFLVKMGGAALAAGWSKPPAAAAGANKNQNVLFIAVDDLNDWIGCLGGHPDVRTPNMDRLARRGVLFSNAHCPAPLCNASRAALLTGVRPSSSGVYTNSQPMRQSEALRDAVTLPQYFMSNGYRVNRTVNLMDIYPTLIELCGLQARNGIEGASLLPLLRNPQAEWNRPSVTTYLRNNHSVRSERWRYIRYGDGTEELYDHRNDPLEWNNLAGKPELKKVKAELALWLTKINAPESPASTGAPEGDY